MNLGGEPVNDSFDPESDGCSPDNRCIMQNLN